MGDDLAKKLTFDQVDRLKAELKQFAIDLNREIAIRCHLIPPGRIPFVDAEGVKKVNEDCPFIAKEATWKLQGPVQVFMLDTVQEQFNAAVKRRGAG